MAHTTVIFKRPVYLPERGLNNPVFQVGDRVTGEIRDGFFWARRIGVTLEWVQIVDNGN